MRIALLAAHVAASPILLNAISALGALFDVVLPHVLLHLDVSSCVVLRPGLVLLAAGPVVPGDVAPAGREEVDVTRVSAPFLLYQYIQLNAIRGHELIYLQC